ncbi:hypothetical protein F5X68DRAFT_206958 [Plectosphaerella plurivora]|uniref:Uncharacterized protein n=1 Tax=Plectosphaerella plurivora TaxID=936078 RepID=A0A9P8VA30_9PEZI|nr:hypothetical protein F5X68DRAFT_206958 [Plectosphaerella plurivora]
MTLPGYISNDNPSLLGIDVLTTFKSCDNDCDSSSDMVQPLAVRCTLIPCVQSYRAGVVNGVYWEKHGDTAAQELQVLHYYRASNQPQIAYALVTNSTLIDGKQHRCDSTTERVPDSVLVDAESSGIEGLTWTLSPFEENYEPDWRYFPQKCVWTFDMASALGISRIVGELVSQNLTVRTVNAVVDGPPWLRSMWADWQGNITTVEDVVRGLANTLTAAIRNSAHKKALKHANGVAISTQTCIYVSWGWIAYPAALLVLQTTFSILVLAGPRTRSGRGRPRPSAWKSSPLALLFHGLDDQVRRENTGLRTVAQMDEAGRKIKVQLSRMDVAEDGGWQLCKD